MIVSNTTPLSSLLKIGKAHLLQDLYGVVTIPPEVAAELDQAGAIHEGWRGQLGFVRVAESCMNVVLAAAERGFINDPFDVLQDLRMRGGLWLSDAFIEQLQSRCPPGASKGQST